MRPIVSRAVTFGTLILAVFGTITCSGDSLVPPGADSVAAIAVVSGNGQSGVVGQPLADPITVRLTGANNDPVPGARVAFLLDADAAGASASPDTATAGSNGEASTTWTLPTTVGTATIAVHVVGAPATELTAEFTASATAGPADTIFVASGQDQAGPALEQLPESLKVRVTDLTGNGVGGVQVTWTWTDNGQVSPAATTTNVEGYAAAARTLGNTAQTTTSMASASGLKGSPVTFTDHVVQPATVTILTQPSSTAVGGTPFGQQPVVQVRDPQGNAINGIQVVASMESGTGTLDGAKTAVTSGGSAAFIDLAISGGTGSHVLRFSSGSAFAISSPIAVTAPTGEDKGQWAPPVPMPLVAVHVSLLPNGKVLIFSRTTQPYLWDPTNPSSFTPVPVGTNVFCSGHTLMPDGRVIVVGGHINEATGLPDANIFDPVGNTWTRLPDMLRGRWYPSATVLSNGDILVLGGRDQLSQYTQTPEIWTAAGGWRALPNAARNMPYYPRMFVTPNGKTFFAGEPVVSRYFDPSGNGTWGPGIPRVVNQIRDYGSAVMYEPGKIIYIGGGQPPTNTAEVIDLNQASPSWHLTGSMAFARRHMNATLLPDGQIFVPGGTSADGFNNASGAVHTAEMWNPATERWTTLAANAIDRMYHSTSLLLPDGRVLFAGSGEGAGGVSQKTYEMYSPPYLFKGPRPTITAAPASVSYGQSFPVETPDAASIQKVSIIRLGSVTHAFDLSQRFLSLSFSAAGGQLSVTAPANGNLAPPGHYLLTILNGSGVPSVSKIVRIQ
ncbi:MAG TPA: galactose oxidase-like domain-containing protein [Gemmatimonadales bacterium]|nr:galactose oxidase-like domain-containing protein [Gemmatimonadales bacterium]